MFYKLLIVCVLTIAMIIILILLWRKSHQIKRSRSDQGNQVSDFEDVLNTWGFEDIHARTCLQTHLLYASGTHNGYAYTLEFGDGIFDDYLRITCRFEASLGQGITVLCEDRLGILGTLLKFRETVLDERLLDDEFILNATDKARLVMLFKYRPVRQALMDLRVQVADLVVNDEFVFIYLEDLPSAQELGVLFDLIEALADELKTFASHYGPVSSATDKVSYTELLDKMNIRDELDVELNELVEEQVMPEGFSDVAEIVEGNDDKIAKKKTKSKQNQDAKQPPMDTNGGDDLLSNNE